MAILDPRFDTFPIAALDGEIGFAAGVAGWGGERTTGFNSTVNFGITRAEQLADRIGLQLPPPKVERAYQFSITGSRLANLDQVGWIQFSARSGNGGPETLGVAHERRWRAIL